MYLGQELQPQIMLQYQKPTFNATNVYLVYGNLHFQPLGHIVLISFVAIYKVLSQILCKLVLGLRIMAYVFGWKQETYFLLHKYSMKIIHGPRTTTERSGKRHGVKWIRVE